MNIFTANAQNLIKRVSFAGISPREVQRQCIIRTDGQDWARINIATAKTVTAEMLVRNEVL